MHYIETILMNNEPSALPHYFETQFLKVELHHDREIRNFRKSLFSKKSASEPATSCSRGIEKGRITLDEFEKMINYNM